MGQTNWSYNVIIYNISLRHTILINELGIQKITQIIKKKSIISLFILLEKVQAVVQKTSRKNLKSTVLTFCFLFFLVDVMGGKNHNQLKRTALK